MIEILILILLMALIAGLLWWQQKRRASWELELMYLTRHQKKNAEPLEQPKKITLKPVYNKMRQWHRSWRMRPALQPLERFTLEEDPLKLVPQEDDLSDLPIFATSQSSPEPTPKTAKETIEIQADAKRSRPIKHQKTTTLDTFRQPENIQEIAIDDDVNIAKQATEAPLAVEQEKVVITTTELNAYRRKPAIVPNTKIKPQPKHHLSVIGDEEIARFKSRRASNQISRVSRQHQTEQLERAQIDQIEREELRIPAQTPVAQNEQKVRQAPMKTISMDDIRANLLRRYARLEHQASKRAETYQQPRVIHTSEVRANLAKSNSPAVQRIHGVREERHRASIIPKEARFRGHETIKPKSNQPISTRFTPFDVQEEAPLSSTPQFKSTTDIPEENQNIFEHFDLSQTYDFEPPAPPKLGWREKYKAELEARRAENQAKLAEAASNNSLHYANDWDSSRTSQIPTETRHPVTLPEKKSSLDDWESLSAKNRAKLKDATIDPTESFYLSAYQDVLDQKIAKQQASEDDFWNEFQSVVDHQFEGNTERNVLPEEDPWNFSIPEQALGSTSSEDEEDIYQASKRNMPQKPLSDRGWGFNRGFVRSHQEDVNAQKKTVIHADEHSHGFRHHDTEIIDLSDALRFDENEIRQPETSFRQPESTLGEHISVINPPILLPSLSLLAPAQKEYNAGQSGEEIISTSITIEEKLAEFKVKVKVIDAYAGPVITRYEIEPDVGVRGNQVMNLEKDLARALGCASIRIVETIPGKTCMGLELPNPQRQIIRLSSILGSQAFIESSSKLTLALGEDITGNSIVTDLAKAPHLLVAGTTGSGKSVGVNAMILSLLYKATPDEVRLIMVDPKMLELSIYEGIPHLLAPVVTDMKLAANALTWCVNEMEKRYRLMSHLGVRNIAGYNQRIADAAERGQKLGNPFSLTPDNPEPLEKLPFIVVIVDEFADLMMTVGKKIEELIARLAQKARAAGIHLILATQRPSVDVITGLIKANIPTRIAFQVSSKVDSRTILDQMGAENLLGQGDMLFLPPGSGYPQRIHGAFVADEEVHRVVEYLKQFGEPNYIDDILTAGVGADDLFSNAISGGSSDGESDPLYDEAVALVMRTKKASISAVQRHLRIGYQRAARLIDQMEAAGVVSAPEHNGTRTILVQTHHMDGE